MTKGLAKKTLALSAGILMLGSIAATGLVGADLFHASAEGEEIPTLIVEEVDFFDSVGYKIEKKSGSLDVEGTQHEYDYVVTYFAGIETYNSNRDWIYINNDTEKLVFNVSTSDGYDITNSEAISTSKWTMTTTDESVAEISAFKRKAPAVWLEIKKNNSQAGQAVVTATVSGADDNATLSGRLRILMNAIVPENVEYTFTGISKATADKDCGVELKYNESELVGVFPATDPEVFGHAEWYINDKESGNTGFFFKGIYFLKNFDLANATAETLAAAAEGNDLYTIMNSDRTEGAPYFQIELRHGNIELFKKTRTQNDETEGGTQRDEGALVAFNAGDAIYLKAGMKMLGINGAGNWIEAKKAGSYNVLARDQIFVFDGENWSEDQFAVSLSIDQSTALVETGATVTVTATRLVGKFVSADDAEVTYTSENPDIATVDSATGVVTGVASGEATITASLANGATKKCVVTVVSATEIKSVTIKKTADAATALRNVTLYTSGDSSSATAVAVVEGGSQCNKAVTWSSQNEAVAMVDQNGKITAAGVGSTKIVATAADGKTAEVTVTVLQSAEEDPTPAPGGDDNKNDNNNNNENNQGGDKKDDGKGCGSSITGSVAGISLAVVVLGAAVVMSVRRKKD